MIKQVIFCLQVYKKYLGRRLYIVFLLSALAAAVEGLGIAMLLPLMAVADVGVGGESVERNVISIRISDILNMIGIGNSVISILIMIALIFLVKGFIVYIAFAYQAHLKSELLGEIKVRMFNDMSEMKYTYYMKKNAGYFINIMTSQITGMVQSFDQFKKFLTTIISTTIYIILAFLLAWSFAVFAIILGLISIFLFRNLNKKVYVISKKAVDEHGELNKYLIQMIQSFKYLSATDKWTALHGKVVSSIYKLTSYKRSQGLALSFTTALLEPIAIFCVLMVVVIQLTVIKAPIGPIFVSLLLFNRAMGSILSIQQIWQSTLDKIGSLDQVELEFSKLEKNREISGNRNIGPLSDSIRIQDLTFRYQKSHRAAVDNINLSIPANSTVAFVGESGSGKSTLVDLITYMIRPDEGEIYIDSVPGHEFNFSSWRSQIGFVSQETVMFDDTIAHNISLLPESQLEENMDRIRTAARQAYADRFIEEMQEGYNTSIGDRGIRLSGGQRQRIFLARELFKNPRLLILDEATSALDSESERYVTESIEHLHGNSTIIIIAHRLSSIANVDMIYVLDEGKIIEQGTYGELIDQQGVFCRMASLQLHNTEM